MYTLSLTDNLAHLHGNKKKGYKLPFRETSEVIESKIQIGTKLLIESDNDRVSKHSGTYYILYMQEFGLVKLLYLDSNSVLREVYSGALQNAVTAIYRNVADGTEIKVLKSSGKRVYRVLANFKDRSEVDDNSVVVPLDYKNKSSQAMTQVYLSLFDAINWAVYLRNKWGDNTYSVVTPKNTVLFTV